MAVTRPSKYGNAPLVVGSYFIAPSEMMFVQYMPIRMPGYVSAGEFRIPPHLRCFQPLVDALKLQEELEPDDYVYLTAKHLWVSPANMGNRPGWHSDGFGTDDVNYIWSDCFPTEFCLQPFELSEDCDLSMAQMAVQARDENIRTFGANMFLRLDSGVVHRVPAEAEEGYRTFVKLSVSKSRYNLAGNAHNYLFDYDWDMAARGADRNHPHKA